VLRIARIVDATEAEGPGVRTAVWLQGCPLRCPGCCNPEMLPFAGGEELAPRDVAARVDASGSEGVTFLGGEPFAQADGVADVAEAVRTIGGSVMVFSGFHLEELTRRRDRGTQRLLAASDLLVDGPYDREAPDTRRRWIGSTNQRMHFLTKRYDPADPIFTSANTVEIRLRHGELSVNGWPALADALLARRRRGR
jgi:anaerobic ribonucleoside-triphosphate reductase activating protein